MPVVTKLSELDCHQADLEGMGYEWWSELGLKMKAIGLPGAIPKTEYSRSFYEQPGWKGFEVSQEWPRTRCQTAACARRIDACHSYLALPVSFVKDGQSVSIFILSAGRLGL